MILVRRIDSHESGLSGVFDHRPRGWPTVKCRQSGQVLLLVLERSAAAGEGTSTTVLPRVAPASALPHARPGTRDTLLGAAASLTLRHVQLPTPMPSPDVKVREAGTEIGHDLTLAQQFPLPL